jgi:hypothetical protein
LSLAQFLDFLGHYNGAIVAAAFLFLALLTNRAKVWVWGTDVQQFKADIEALRVELRDTKRDNERLTKERDEARFFAIAGVRASEAFAEQQRRLP